MIYFDNAATTLVKPKEVLDTLYDLSFVCGNSGRSSHSYALKSSEVIFNTREKICDFFNFSKPENVIFTYNATYALNLAIKGCITEKCTVLTSSFEHNSTIRPLMGMQNVTVKVVKSDLYNHHQFINNFKNSITSDTKYAVINHISNVFGYILPIKEIDKICFEHNIKLILDISQSAGILDIDLSTFKSVICVCMPAHKSLYGPMGLGIMIAVSEDIKKSLIEGGTGSLSNSIIQPDFLPDMLESGTPNVPAIGALYQGIEYNMQNINIKEHIFNLASYFYDQISVLDNTTCFFCKNPDLQTGVVSFFNHNIGNEELSSLLSHYDICTRAGFHCAPLAHQSANTNGTVRVSFSSFNDFFEIDEFINVYKHIQGSEF